MKNPKGVATRYMEKHEVRLDLMIKMIRRRPTPATPRHPSPLLPLLPSGPDGVHSLSSRGDRCKSPLTKIPTLPDERDKWSAYYQGLFPMTNACELFLWARSTVSLIIYPTVPNINVDAPKNNQK